VRHGADRPRGFDDSASHRRTSSRRRRCRPPAGLAGGIPIRSADRLGARIDPTTPLIVLTREADAPMRVRFLEHGGDDVVLKPFLYRELLARTGAVLRRTHQPPQGRMRRISEIEIDLIGQSVLVAGQPVELAPRNTHCSSTSPASRRACSPRPSCCATCGAIAR
jgi:hypothetical protein